MIEQILAHLGLPADPPSSAPARSTEWLADQSDSAPSVRGWALSPSVTPLRPEAARADRISGLTVAGALFYPPSCGLILVANEVKTHPGA